MKLAKVRPEKKSAGTVIVEKYRPRLNKLTTVERERLRLRALRIAYGDEPQPAPSHRR